VSVDAQPSQKRFAEELGVQFPLLSDFPHRRVSELYGVLDSDRGVARRTTFVIDQSGVIRRIDSGRDALEIVGVKDTCSALQ
jgi:peroxiredoxin